MQSPRRRWLISTLVILLFGGVIVTRAVTEPNNDFRFSIIGDRTGGNTPGVYSRVWREVDLLHPDFVINVGDTIQRSPDDKVQGEWDRLHPLFHRYSHYPLYFTPGNHDVFSETSKRIYEQETGHPTFYGFNYQDAHFTVLDNSQTTELSDAQLKFFEQDMTENRKKHPKFLFFHKPYWILPLKLESGEFPLHRLAKRLGVDYVISGHGHQFARFERDGIVYMEVGSSGGRMRGIEHGQGFREGWFYHHVWARVKGSKVSFTVKEIDGPYGKGRMFNAEDWSPNGPTFDPDDPASGVPDL